MEGMATMERIRATSIAQRLAALAGLVAAGAALAGFIPGAYRDPGPLVVQSHGQDIATLLIALPVLALGWRRAVHGSIRGRLVTIGVLGYLLYTYAVYAFVSVLGPLTLLDVAVVGLAAWSIAYAGPDVQDDEVEAVVGPHLRRRATGVFLLVLAALFALLWTSQIAAASINGRSPQALIDAGWPTSPIYVLDLAFALPLAVVTARRLLTGRRGGVRLAVPYLVFAALLASGIVVMSLVAGGNGETVDVFQVALFGVMTLVSGTLGAIALDPRSTAVKRVHSLAG
jgi:hypothetical protein